MQRTEANEMFLMTFNSKCIEHCFRISHPNGLEESVEVH